jgi:transposase
VRQDLVVLRARDALVAARTELINATRGLVKSMGTRLPKCSSPSFAEKVEGTIPAELSDALLPLVRMAAALSDCIRGYDKKIEKLGQEKYGHTALLRQVKGVGPITALAYVLTLENPDRFVKSRDVGPYLGLVPKQEDSGEMQPQLGISKTGDTMVRKLLVSAGQYILGPFGPDTDLRRFGLRLCERGGKNAKKRAAVAVARKLAVLLHCLWVSGGTRSSATIAAMPHACATTNTYAWDTESAVGRSKAPTNSWRMRDCAKPECAGVKSALADSWLCAYFC